MVNQISVLCKSSAEIKLKQSPINWFVVFCLGYFINQICQTNTLTRLLVLPYMSSQDKTHFINDLSFLQFLQTFWHSWVVETMAWTNADNLCNHGAKVKVESTVIYIVKFEMLSRDKTWRNIVQGDQVLLRAASQCSGYSWQSGNVPVSLHKVHKLCLRFTMNEAAPQLICSVIMGMGSIFLLNHR